MSRILGIDFGTVRIGLALSDERGILASPLPCLKAGKSLEVTAQLLVQEFAKHMPLRTIVIGLPLHMSGHESPLSQEVRKLKSLFEALCSVPIALWDERLSTAQVERGMKDAGLKRKKRSEIVDSLSAVLILQNFLDQPSFA